MQEVSVEQTSAPGPFLPNRLRVKTTLRVLRYGSNLRKLAERRGLKPSDIAKQAEVPLVTVKRLFAIKSEEDIFNIRLQDALSVSAVLNVSIAEMMRG